MRRGGEINFCLMRGGYDLVLGHISPISQPSPPPLQLIIAQSLNDAQTLSDSLRLLRKPQGAR